MPSSRAGSLLRLRLKQPFLACLKQRRERGLTMARHANRKPRAIGYVDGRRAGAMSHRALRLARATARMPIAVRPIDNPRCSTRPSEYNRLRSFSETLPARMPPALEI